jgi:hypothetical protein
MATDADTQAPSGQRRSIVWGLLAAQFFVQTATSLVIAFIFLSGLLFSRVRKSNNAAGLLASVVQTAIFASLVIGGNWFAKEYFLLAPWNANLIAATAAFCISLVYCAVQVPGKILLARTSAWKP